LAALPQALAQPDEKGGNDEERHPASEIDESHDESLLEVRLTEVL